MKTFSEQPDVLYLTVNKKTGEMRVYGHQTCDICKLFGTNCSGNKLVAECDCLVPCG